MRFCLCVVGATLIACGSMDSSVDDAGADAYGHKNFDATADVNDAAPFGDVGVPKPEAEAPPAACGAVDTSSFTPTWTKSWVPPAAFGGSSCTDKQIYDYLLGCMAGNLDPASCATKLGQPSSLDCFTCLAPTKTSEGPFRAVQERCGLPQAFNVGGCLANALGTTCATAWMNANECDQIACSTCSCMGGEDGWDNYHPCVDNNNNKPCDALEQSAACALGSTSPIVEQCLAVVAPTSNQALLDFVKLFCGAPPSDAGTD